MRAFHSIASIITAVLLFITAVTVQTLPDFSGVWVSVTPQTGGNDKVQIKQDATELTQTREAGGSIFSLTYKLDGTQTRTENMGITFITSAKWQGTSLVLTSATANARGGMDTLEEVWSFNADKQLVVETSERRSSVPPKTKTIIYTKQ